MKTEDTIVSKYKYGNVVLNADQAKAIGEGKTTQVTRTINGDRWFLRISVGDSTPKVSKKVEYAKVQLVKLNRRIAKLAAIVGDHVKADGSVALKVRRRYRRSYRKACPVCHKKFRVLKLHIGLAHNGTLKSNLPHLKKANGTA